MSATIIGRQSWAGERDEQGHRTFTVRHKIKTSDPEDGPFTVMSCPGLYSVGSLWFVGNDSDGWAFCWPTMKCSPFAQKEGEKHRFWIVEQTFSTKYPPSRRCGDTQIEDPLLEPMKISGSFIKYTEEASYDRNGDQIKYSNHEQVRGKYVEFDANRPTVKIEQNVSGLELDVFSQMVDTLNDAPLWGLDSRRIKLSNVTWAKNFYGTCNYYYTRTFDFDIRYDGFDRDIIDEGNKVLNGHWEDTGWVLDDINGSPPNPDNPQHFIQFKDRHDENCRTVLDGAGKPFDGTGTTGPGNVHIEKYGEANFLDLGVPILL